MALEGGFGMWSWGTDFVGGVGGLLWALALIGRLGRWFFPPPTLIDARGECGLALKSPKVSSWLARRGES